MERPWPTAAGVSKPPKWLFSIFTTSRGWDTAQVRRPPQVGLDSLGRPHAPSADGAAAAIRRALSARSGRARWFFFGLRLSYEPAEILAFRSR